MNFLPKFKRCPCCNAVNLFKVNGAAYKSEFKSLIDWTLKRKITCRKCRVEFGLFVNSDNTIEKIIWIDMIKCEDDYLDQLNKLQKNKEKYKENNKELKYLKTIKEIEDVLNQMRLDQIKIKVKARIQNKNMLI